MARLGYGNRKIKKDTRHPWITLEMPAGLVLGLELLSPVRNERILYCDSYDSKKSAFKRLTARITGYSSS